MSQQGISAGNDRASRKSQDRSSVEASKKKANLGGKRASITTCPTCRSTKWVKDPSSGDYFCSQGHQLLNYRQEEADADSIAGSQRRTRHQKKRVVSTVREGKRLLKPKAPKSIEYQLFQDLLKLLISECISKHHFPPELEMVAMDLWLLLVTHRRISLLDRKARSKNWRSTTSDGESSVASGTDDMELSDVNSEFQYSDVTSEGGGGVDESTDSAWPSSPNSLHGSRFPLTQATAPHQSVVERMTSSPHFLYRDNSSAGALPLPITQEDGLSTTVDSFSGRGFSDSDDAASNASLNSRNSRLDSMTVRRLRLQPWFSLIIIYFASNILRLPVLFSDILDLAASGKISYFVTTKIPAAFQQQFRDIRMNRRQLPMSYIKTVLPMLRHFYDSQVGVIFAPPNLPLFWARWASDFRLPLHYVYHNLNILQHFFASDPVKEKHPKAFQYPITDEAILGPFLFLTCLWVQSTLDGKDCGMMFFEHVHRVVSALPLPAFAFWDVQMADLATQAELKAYLDFCATALSGRSYVKTPGTHDFESIMLPPESAEENETPPPRPMPSVLTAFPFTTCTLDAGYKAFQAADKAGSYPKKVGFMIYALMRRYGACPQALHDALTAVERVAEGLMLPWLKSQSDSTI